MKKLLLPALLGLAAVITAPASRALTANGDFQVTVNLYPKCEITMPAGALTLNYVSFQGSASENTKTFQVKCTKTLPFTYVLGGTKPGGDTIVGLPYTLTAVDSTGTLTNGGVGDGLDQTFGIKASIAAGLAGECDKDSSGDVQPQVAGGANVAGNGSKCWGTSASGVHQVQIIY